MCVCILLVLWTLSLSRDQTFLFQYVLWHCNLLSHDNRNGILKWIFFLQVRRLNSFKCLWPNTYCVQLCRKKTLTHQIRSTCVPAFCPFLCMFTFFAVFSVFVDFFFIAANISIVQVVARCCEYGETISSEIESGRKRGRVEEKNVQFITPTFSVYHLYHIV